MASITADCFLSMQATTYVDYNQILSLMLMGMLLTVLLVLLLLVVSLWIMHCISVFVLFLIFLYQNPVDVPLVYSCHFYFTPVSLAPLHSGLPYLEHIE